MLLFIICEMQELKKRHRHWIHCVSRVEALRGSLGGISVSVFHNPFMAFQLFSMHTYRDMFKAPVANLIWVDFAPSVNQVSSVP